MSRSVALLLFLLLLLCAACAAESTRGAAPPPAVQVDISPAAPPTSVSIVSSAATRPPPPPLSLTPVEPTPDPAFCGGKCAGTPNPALIDAVSKRALKAHRCYDNELVRTADLEGRVVVKMRIGSDGRMCSARGLSDPKMEAVATCVAGYFRSAVGDQSLAAPTGGCADLDLPINFVRTGDAGVP